MTKKPSRLEQLRSEARTLGVKIDAEKDDFGWAYWLMDAKTGETVWADGNFCTSLDEVADKLEKRRHELAVC